MEEGRGTCGGLSIAARSTEGMWRVVQGRRVGEQGEGERRPGLAGDGQRGLLAVGWVP